jgi:hypothetical protein
VFQLLARRRRFALTRRGYSDATRLAASSGEVDAPQGPGISSARHQVLPPDAQP